ncbi:hypothetical protein HDU96_009265 [Phlyctochytrium bullatum]|nr:hypothetical protein HDU96_009265 [Phlyctochytrium bullatum]
MSAVSTTSESTGNASSSSQGGGDSNNGGLPSFVIPIVCGTVIAVLVAVCTIFAYRYFRRRRAAEADHGKSLGLIATQTGASADSNYSSQYNAGTASLPRMGGGSGAGGYVVPLGQDDRRQQRNNRRVSRASSIASLPPAHPTGSTDYYPYIPPAEGEQFTPATPSLRRSASQSSHRATSLARRPSLASVDGSVYGGAAAYENYPPVPALPNGVRGGGAAAAVTVPGSSMLLDVREVAAITRMNPHDVQAEANGWGPRR